jgi:glucosyl-dolichyl phosphate glucuronosyltransferase
VTTVTEPPNLTISVIICAYTMDRWKLLTKAVESARNQTYPALEVIVSIDHNDDLFAAASQELATPEDVPGVPVTVIRNRYDGRLGSARNSAAEIARGDVLAFLDDDARANSTWLENLVVPYGDDDVAAVGGAPLPDMATWRPRWFPPEFDWVFGCSYVGLPTSAAPVRRLIGASMSARRHLLAEIGGFHSDNHDDMDMCHRLAVRAADAKIIYQPAAVVMHHVPAERLTWHYFWRRCFFVNRGKVAAFRGMENAASLSAERSFARQMLTNGVRRELRRLAHGDLAAPARMGAMVAGMFLAGLGYAVGTVEYDRTLKKGRPAVR